MRSGLIQCLLPVVALGLAACSPPASDTQSGQAAAPAASSQAASTAAMRPGRWNKVITVMGQQTHEVECVTTSDINEMASEPNSNCTSANGFQRTPEGLVYEATCTGEDGGGNIRTVLTGDLQNHYVVDSTMTGAGEASAMNMQIHIEGTYEGACRGDE